MTISLPRAAFGALTIELVLLLLGVLMVSHMTLAPPKAQSRDVMQMVIVPPVPELHKAKPVVHKPQPQPQPQPRPVTPRSRPVIHQPVPKVTHHAIIRKITKRVLKPIHHPLRHTVNTKPKAVSVSHRKSVKTPLAASRQKVTPLQAQAAVVTPAYRSQVREAVQRAVKYPFAARIAQITGKVRVSFVYSQGHVSDEHVLVSSGAAVLDQAALSAVINAIIPMPPKNLRGRVLHFSIWVRFFMEHS